MNLQALAHTMSALSGIAIILIGSAHFKKYLYSLL